MLGKNEEKVGLPSHKRGVPGLSPGILEPSSDAPGHDPGVPAPSRLVNGPCARPIITHGSACLPAVWFGRNVEEWLLPLLHNWTLELQACSFESTMLANAHATISLPLIENPMSRLWSNLSQNAMISSKLSRYFKLAEIDHVLVLCIIEDEQTFSLIVLSR